MNEEYKRGLDARSADRHRGLAEPGSTAASPTPPISLWWRLVDRYLRARNYVRSFALKDLRLVRKVVVAVVGFTVLLIGLALIVLPGPAFIVIPLGLTILASEFVWAKSILKKARKKLPWTQAH